MPHEINQDDKLVTFLEDLFGSTLIVGMPEPTSSDSEKEKLSEELIEPGSRWSKLTYSARLILSRHASGMEGRADGSLLPMRFGPNDG